MSTFNNCMICLPSCEFSWSVISSSWLFHLFFSSYFSIFAGWGVTMVLSSISIMLNSRVCFRLGPCMCFYDIIPGKSLQWDFVKLFGKCSLLIFLMFLKVYTRCGRRALPTMMMGSAATFIDCDESWKLLLVTRKGSLYVWDLFNRNCLLHDSLASLITLDPVSSVKGTEYLLFVVLG